MLREDEITLIKWTVAMEAENQKYEGMLGVAFTVMNRVRQWKKSVADVCLQAYQFNAWDSKSPTRMRLDTISDVVMSVAHQAALSAYDQKEPDPTLGATFYHNPKTSDPNWKHDSHFHLTVSIGDHDFYREIK